MPLYLQGTAPVKPSEPELTLSIRPSSYAGRFMLQATDASGKVTKIARFALKNGRLVFNRRVADGELVAIDEAGRIVEDTSI